MATTIGPLLSSLLDRYNLSSLKDWAAQMAVTGASEDEIILSLYEQPALHAEYPWIKQREAAGYVPQSIEEFLTYRNFAQQTAKAYGMTLTKEEIDALFAGDVSVQELERDRLVPASAYLYSFTPTARAQVNVLYGITDEDVMRGFLDPKQQAPILRKRLASAQIAAQAMTTGFGQLTAAQAEGLYESGLDETSAREGFGRLTQMGELFQATDLTEEDISTDEQLGVLTGNQNTLTQLERRRQRRTGQFEQGGGFATSGKGVSGLGSANR
jgi:hypothetical protein